MLAYSIAGEVERARRHMTQDLARKAPCPVEPMGHPAALDQLGLELDVLGALLYAAIVPDIDRDTAGAIVKALVDDMEDRFKQRDVEPATTAEARR